MFSIGPFLLNILSTFLTYIGFLIFFNLNLCFLANSEFITNPIALLFSNASTITLSYISILSNPIFIVTSLNMSPLFRLQHNILSVALMSITNLLQESN